MTSNRPSSGYLSSLDGWRAIAVSAVMLDHCQPVTNPYIHRFQGYGGVGVTTFFAISGILITSRMLDEEEAQGCVSLRNFYIRRAFRILPPALLYLFVIAILGALAVIPFDKLSWVSAVFFYRNYWQYIAGGDASSWFTGHFWSLSVEEHYYFLLPAIFVFLPRFRRTALVLLSVANAVWLAYYLMIPPGKSPRYFFDLRTDFCIIGLLIPSIWALSLHSPQVKYWSKKCLRSWIAIPFFLIALSGVLRINDSGVSTWISLMVRALLAPVLILSTVLHPGSWLTRLLELRPLKAIGRISYGLYLWQSLFLTKYFIYPSRIHFLQRPAIGFFCTYLCAIASYFLLEQPMIRLGRKLSTARRLAPDPLAVASQ
jgi:peptidoglycan/LPS O-acetylase OafA/YrhL